MLIGIVGKPNVGKSTFFKSMTLAEVEIANYPFATINPNTGAGHVKIKDVANLSIIIPSVDTARIQEVHITIGHIICELIEEDL